MKRADKFVFNNNNAKKPKLQLQQKADDIWGDDPEIEEVDKCIDLATQLCSQNTQNKSMCYDDFKSREQVYTSTQAQFLHPAIPSTSKNFKPEKEVNNLDNSVLSSSIRSTNTIINNAPYEYQKKLTEKIEQLERQNKKLVENFETKDGENAILRAQLKIAQKTIDTEKLEKHRCLEQTQQNWTAKLHNINKEASGLKVELELKNLEIVNLKEKMYEKNRHSLLNNSSVFLDNTIPYSPSNTAKKRKNSITQDNCSKKRTIDIQTDTAAAVKSNIAEIYYPLNELISPTLFDKCEDEHSIIHLNTHGSIPAFRHNMEPNDYVINLKPNITMENNMLPTVEYLHPDIILLMKCTEEELNSQNMKSTVNKILLVTMELLFYLSNKLNIIEQNMNYEDLNCIQEDSDSTQYCIFTGKPWCEHELVIDLRRCLAVIAALTQHSVLTQKYLTGQILLNHDIDSTYLKFVVDFQIRNPRKSSFEFLYIVLSITKTIRKIGRCHQFLGFLASVLKLLSSLSREELPLECYKILYSVFREIIFMRPNRPIIKYLSEFLRHISYRKQFLALLCKMSNEVTKTNIVNEDTTQDFCVFQVLEITLIEHNRDVSVNCDIIQFLKNTITCNIFGIGFQESRRCKCLMDLYNIAINTLYNSLEDYLLKNAQINDRTILQTYTTIFREGLLFLHVLSVRNSDLVIRCTPLIPQYQTIIKNLKTIQESLHFGTTHQNALETLLTQFKTQLNNDAQQSNVANTRKNTLDSFFNHGFRFSLDV